MITFAMILIILMGIACILLSICLPPFQLASSLLKRNSFRIMQRGYYKPTIQNKRFLRWYDSPVFHAENNIISVRQGPLYHDSIDLAKKYAEDLDKLSEKKERYKGHVITAFRGLWFDATELYKTKVAEDGLRICGYKNKNDLYQYIDRELDSGMRRPVTIIKIKSRN